MRDYPPSSLVLAKGKWYVQVTVPTDLRPCFNGRKQERISTRTTDKAFALRQQHDLTTSIYSRFDLAKRELDPLVVAAKHVVAPLHGHKGWSAADWEPDSLEHSAHEVRMAAAAVLDVELYDQSGRPLHLPEEGMLISEVQSQVEPAYFDFEQQLADRKRLASECRLTVSQLADQYWPTKTFNRVKTANAFKAAVRKFVKFSGDIKIALVDRKTAKSFLDMLASKHAYNTLQRDFGVVRNLFDYAMDLELIPTNPFQGISTKGRGTPAKKGKPLRRSQLEQLFALEMLDQDRLCLSILAATGMRLDEVALLEWGDVRTESGIRYFDLTNVSKIVKNPTAMRDVPIHPNLVLPTSGTGRFFDFKTDIDGKAEKDASRRLMKYVMKVRSNPDDVRENVHSLRHSFKDMMRDHSVPKYVHDSILGHKELGQGGNYGDGVSLRVKAMWLAKADLSFLMVDGRVS